MPDTIPHELDIAKAIRDGSVESGTRVENVHLYAMRITGTGAAYRRGLDEYTWRDPAVYLNDDFVARCNGLAVIFEHPEKRTLDSQEYADRNVGSIVLPYIKGDEVWGIAKIYDDATVDLFKRKQMSTSPTVIFRDETVNTTTTLEDGTPLLIEGDPSHLDHVAICELGVWDKGGEPQGINHGVLQMTDEEKKEAEAKAAKEKADAETPAWAKSIADSVGSLAARMDSWDKEKADAAKAKADEEKSEEEKEKEAKAKADAEREEEDKKKADAARADSEALRKKIADMEASMPRERTDSDVAELADAQSRCDTVAMSFGKQARAPMSGETPIAYRRRLANEYKQHSPGWKDIDLALLPDAALKNAEVAIYADAQAAARSPVDLPAGTLRAIHKRDHAGRTITEYVGDPEGWLGAFKSPVRHRLVGVGPAQKGA